jgi:nicotinamidase-related amidase
MLTVVLVVDPQRDFCEGGSLAVPGANAALCEVSLFLNEAGEAIDGVAVTLDVHVKGHIATQVSWTDDKGNPPPSFSAITHADVKTGTWRYQNPTITAGGEAFALAYMENSKTLTIWPEHCLEGSPGQEVQPGLRASLDSFTARTGKAITYFPKGRNVFTESYSAVEAQVPITDAFVQELSAAGVEGVLPDLTTGVNEALLTLVMGCRVIVGGLALSHCVMCTVLDLIRLQPSIAPNLIIMSDGTSSVEGYEQVGEDFLAQIRSLGGKVLTRSEVVDLLTAEKKKKRKTTDRPTRPPVEVL